MGQLDSFLESEPQGVVEAEQVEAQPVVADEGVDAVPPAAQEIEQPQQQPTAEVQQPGFVPAAAVVDERRKRQELERQLAEYKEQFQRMQQGQQQPQAAPDPSAVALNMTINMVESVMRHQFKDYDENRNYFLSQAEANPYLLGQLRSAENPALFAYETGKKLRLVEDIGDPIAYREKVKAEILAELQGAQQSETQLAQLAKASDSLATARVVGASAPAQWSGPPSLDDILASKRRR